MSPVQVGNLKAGEHHVMACLPAQRSPRRAGGPWRPELRRPGPHALGRPRGHAHQAVPDSILRWTATGIIRTRCPASTRASRTPGT